MLCLLIALVFKLGLFLFILWDLSLCIFMAFDLARRMKNSEHCSLVKESLMCSNSSFRNLGRRFLESQKNKKTMKIPFFCFIAVVRKMFVVIFVVYFVVNLEF